MPENIINYILSFTIALTFTIACLVSFRRREGDRIATLFLSLMYWVYVYAMTVVFIMENEWVEFFPHCLRTVQIASLVYAPLSYLYVSHTLSPRSLHKRDLLHLIPVLIFIADYAPFFILPGEEKARIFESLRNGRQLFKFEEGLLMPGGGHIVMRYLVMISYLIAQARLIRKHVDPASVDMPSDQKGMVRWLKWLTASQAILILPPLLNLALNLFPVGMLNSFSSMTAGLVQAYFLLSRPEILYGYFGHPPIISANQLLKENNIPLLIKRAGADYSQNGNVHLPKQAWMEELVLRLEQHFKEDQPFLRQGYSMPDLARELDCTTNQLSYLVNNYYGIRFNKLINQYRVQACKEKIAHHEFKNKTLEAIANEVGFNSRATFINAFKTETGKTPSAFIRDLAMT